MATSEINNLVDKCNSIKISPALSDVLAELGFSSDLDDNATMWLKQLKISWMSWKRSVTVENHIESYFASRPDPFRVALVFVRKCDEYKDSKPKSLPYFIMETLLKFSNKYQIYPEESLKMPAFYIAIHQRNQHFLNVIAKTYKIVTVKKFIIPIVNEMIQNDNCRQALQIVIAVEMFDDIPVENLLFPFILQDKPNLVDEYLCTCPGQVKPFLLFLDKLLDKKFNTTEYAEQFSQQNKLGIIKYDKLHYKPLGKLVARLCNKFSIPIETCKNLCKNRTTAGLRYLMYQKYAEKNVSSTVWDDLVKDSLRQNAESAPEFIDMLLDFDKNEALKWARYMNLSQNQLPSSLKGASTVHTDPNEVENWDTDLNSEENYYKSSITREQIRVIDSPEDFYKLINSDLINQTMLSLDCEWKPSFGTTQPQVAIMQVATNDMVYLIDTILLSKQEYSNMWHSFYKSFLDNAEIIKLGFGLDQDLQLMKAIVGLGNLKIKGQGFLDLFILWKSLLNHKLCLPSGNSCSVSASLTAVVQSCFGKPLKKSEQCSNWELRPLRDTQIMYAASDAHVLIEIFNFLEKICKEQEIPFEELCNDIMIESKRKVRKPKVAEKLLQTFIPVYDRRAVSNVKFLIEPALSHLEPYLRYCGFNTTIHSYTMLWHDVINMAIAEDRFILVSKLKITPNENFPQTSILNVGKESTTEQLHKIINTYHVNVKHKDILSICLYCNSKDLKNLDPEEVQKFCTAYAASSSNSNIKYVPNHDEQDDYENFFSGSEDDEIPCYLLPSVTLKPCVTSKGVEITINNPQNLSKLNLPAILCEACGNIYSEYEDLHKKMKEIIFKVTKLDQSISHNK